MARNTGGGACGGTRTRARRRAAEGPLEAAGDGQATHGHVVETAGKVRRGWEARWARVGAVRDSAACSVGSSSACKGRRKDARAPTLALPSTVKEPCIYASDVGGEPGRRPGRPGARQIPAPLLRFDGVLTASLVSESSLLVCSCSILEPAAVAVDGIPRRHRSVARPGGVIGGGREIGRGRRPR